MKKKLTLRRRWKLFRLKQKRFDARYGLEIKSCP